MKEVPCRPLRVCLVPFALLLLASLRFAQAEPAPQHSPADFAALPAFRDAIVSPDGNRVLMLRPVNGVLAPAVLDVAARRMRAVLTMDAASATFDHCVWVSDTRVMCMIVKPLAPSSVRRGRFGFPIEEDYELRRYIAVNVDGSEVVELGPSLDAMLINTLPGDDHRVLLGIGAWSPVMQAGTDLRTGVRVVPNIRPRGDRVELIDTRNNESELVQSATQQTFGWFTDETGKLSASTGDWSDRFVLRSHFAGFDAAGPLAPVEDVRQALASIGVMRRFSDVPFTAPEGEYPVIAHVGSDGVAWIQSRQDGDRKALYALDLRTGKIVRELHRAVRMDVEASPIAAPGSLPIGARIVGDETFFLPTTEEGARLRAELDAALPGGTNIPHSLSRDGTKLTVERIVPGLGSSWYYFDRPARQLALIGHEYPQLQSVPVGRAERLSLTARDGRPIPAVLFHGRAASLPGPVVVIPDPSPFDRERDGFDPLAASIVNLGISVLKVSYRGVPGHGLAHQVAGRGEWGDKIDGDIADAIAQVVGLKLADPARVCMLGVGYAGHLALGAARRGTAAVRCVLSIGGFASVLDLVRERGLTEMTFREREEFPIAVGDREQEARHAHDRHVAEISVPVFLAHGAFDTTLRPHHSERMAAALTQAGKDVTFLPLPTSSSTFAYGPERVQLYEAVSAFLRKHLL